MRGEVAQTLALTAKRCSTTSPTGRKRHDKSKEARPRKWARKNEKNTTSTTTNAKRKNFLKESDEKRGNQLRGYKVRFSRYLGI